MSARVNGSLCLTFAASAFAMMLAYATQDVAASPLKPVNMFNFQVPSSKDPGVPGETDLTLQCRGNERTSVMLKGDHRPVCDLEVLVFEVGANNRPEKLIAHGKGTRDLVGVVFIPERTASFRIVFRNHSEFEAKKNPYNECYLTIK